LKGNGLLERAGRRYAYRLSAKGLQVALLFLFFHKRLCGPQACSRFHHKPDPKHCAKSKLEAAYHKADKAIQDIVDLLSPPDAIFQMLKYSCLRSLSQESSYWRAV
jgi:hypothetical protein